MPGATRHGVIVVLGTMWVVSFQDVIFKLFSAPMTLGQVFALRGVVAVLLLILAVGTLRRRPVAALRAALGLWPLLRALLIAAMLLGFYAAIPFVSLSILGAAVFTAPLFIMLLSALILKDPVGPMGWAAVSIGFAGAAILLRPWADSFSLWAALPLAGAFLYALGHILTRGKCQAIPASVLALSLQIVMAAAGAALSLGLILFPPAAQAVAGAPSLLGGWARLTPELLGALVALAVLAVLAGLGLARAYQVAPPKTVGVFEYVYLVYVAFWDITVFNEPPALWTLLGIVMIVCAGVIILRRG